MTGNIDPEIMKVFAFWSAILVLKMLLMAILTARHRFTKGIFANPEDVAKNKAWKVSYTDLDIERVRRSHLNDLENILPWFMITFLWLGTGPSYWLATMLIRNFVLARIIHTIVYAVIPKQPHRALAFFAGYAITAYEAVNILLYYY